MRREVVEKRTVVNGVPLGKKLKGDAGGRKWKSGEVEREVLSASIVLFDFSFSRCEREVKLLEFLPKDRNLVGIPYRYSDVVL